MALEFLLSSHKRLRISEDGELYPSLPYSHPIKRAKRPVEIADKLAPDMLQSDSSFLVLPPEIIMLILSMISPFDYPRLMRICKAMRIYSSSKQLYSHISLCNDPRSSGRSFRFLTSVAPEGVHFIDLHDVIGLTAPAILELFRRCQNIKSILLPLGDEMMAMPVSALPYPALESFSAYRATSCQTLRIPASFFSVFPNLLALHVFGFQELEWSGVAAVCPKLRSIDTGSVTPNIPSLVDAIKSWSLVSLSIPWFSYVPDRLDDCLPYLTKLEIIQLPRYIMTDPEWLNNMPKLRAIKVVYNSWLSQALTLNVRLEQLEFLDIAGTSEGLDISISAPKLCKLSLARCRVKRAIVAAPALCLVDLTCSDWDCDAFRQFLVGCESLTAMELRGCLLRETESETILEVDAKRLPVDPYSHIPFGDEGLTCMSIEAAFQTTEVCGRTLTDLYIPLEHCATGMINHILTACKFIDTMFLNDCVEIKIAGHNVEVNIDDIRACKYPETSRIVSATFKRNSGLILRTETSALHFASSFSARSFVGLARMTRQDIKQVTLDTFKTKCTALSNLVAWLPNLEELKIVKSQKRKYAIKSDSLQRICIHGCQITSIALDCPNLVGLHIDSLVNFTQLAVPLDRMRRLRKLKVSCSNISPAALLHVAETCSDLDELLIVSKALSLELIGALMTAPIASRLKRVSVPSGFINASVQTFQSLYTTFNSLEQLVIIQEDPMRASDCLVDLQPLLSTLSVVEQSDVRLPQVLLKHLHVNVDDLQRILIRKQSNARCDIIVSLPSPIAPEDRALSFPFSQPSALGQVFARKFEELAALESVGD